MSKEMEKVKELSLVDEKQAKNKEILVEQLHKTPIVQVACEKCNIGRASYYRWHKEDPEFALNADSAIEEGSSLVNDMAESQLLAAIRDQNLTAIIFWLKHHHKSYATRVEVTTKNDGPIQLTPEQEETIRNALVMAQLTNNNEEEVANEPTNK